MSGTMLGVDVGGTFTDVVMVRDGKVHVTKVPSDPAHPERSVVAGARRFGVRDASVFNHASTKGLNAVLTRALPKIGFLTTEGHRDMLDAGRAIRPMDNQTDARWHRPFGDVSRPLVRRYLRRGIRERVLATGEALIPLDEAQARDELELLKRCNVQGVAICLINSYANPLHEQRVLALAREVLGPDVAISASFEVGPRAKEYARASTTVIDVMMKLIYGSYARSLDAGLREAEFGGTLNFADCTASLIPWGEAVRAPHRILFAGPAAGAAACQRFGEAIDDGNLIGCDVGGTSTDVSVVSGGTLFTNDSFEIEHDLLVNTLATEVSSVGAGGGSLVKVSASGDILVGPDSAGSTPGPACYGRGGARPTVTDACVLMGILDPQSFADGQIRLDTDAARRAFESLDCRMSLEDRVRFAWQVALNNIAEEVTRCTLRHGVDMRDFSIMAFGSAGPMLLPAALSMLNARRMIVPPNPGLFSAIGLLSTDFVYADSRSAYLMLMPEMAKQIETVFSELEAGLRQRLGSDAKHFIVKRSFDGRLAGQSWETPFVPVPEGPINEKRISDILEQFHTEYQRRNGTSFRGMPIQGVTWRVQLIVPTSKVEWQPLDGGGASQKPKAAGSRELRYLGPKPVNASVYDRASLGASCVIDGPALITEPLATTLVVPDQRATIGRFGEIVITEA